jgi:hypothetical protein
MNLDERLTRVLIDALLAADDGAVLNALRAAQRLIKGQGADAHRLIVSLREASPPASDPFAGMNQREVMRKKWEMNRREAMRKMWDQARNHVRNSPDPWEKKAKLEELLSRHTSAAFTGGKVAIAAVEAELETLLANWLSPPAVGSIEPGVPGASWTV